MKRCLFLALLLISGALPLPAQEASGYYTVKHVNGIWWLIDPNGNQVICKGLDVLQFDDGYVGAGASQWRQTNMKIYGNKQKWTTAITQRLIDFGFNAAGAWSDPKFLGAQIDDTHAIAETRIVYIGLPYVQQILGPDAWKHPDVFPDVFDPHFEQFANQTAEAQCRPVSDNHWLIGWYSDNEMSWGRTGNELLIRFLRATPETSGHKAALALLQARYPDIATFNKAWKTTYESWDALDADRNVKSPSQTDGGADCDAFVAQVADNYFRITTEAIHRSDPNHLTLGCRFAGPPPLPVIVAAGKYLDVVSFNCYETNPAGRIAQFAKASGRPLIIGEFAFRGRDSGLPNSKGAGPVVATQQDRADDFEKYVKSAMSQPNLIGYNWFQLADEPKEGRFDGENSNMGVVNIHDEPYTVLTDRMKAINPQAETLHQQAK